jgi:hypothetical protein
VLDDIVVVPDNDVAARSPRRSLRATSPVSSSSTPVRSTAIRSAWRRPAQAVVQGIES